MRVSPDPHLLYTGLGNFLETDAKSCSENSFRHFGDNSHQKSPRPELCLQRDRIQTPEPNSRQLCGRRHNHFLHSIIHFIFFLFEIRIPTSVRIGIFNILLWRTEIETSHRDSLAHQHHRGRGSMKNGARFLWNLRPVWIHFNRVDHCGRIVFWFIQRCEST